MTPAVLIYVGLVLARIGTFVGLMPLFGARTSRIVRVGLAVALTAFYLGMVAPGWDPALAKQPGDIHPFVYAMALGREALIGAAMGLAFMAQLAISMWCDPSSAMRPSDHLL